MQVRLNPDGTFAVVASKPDATNACGLDRGMHSGGTARVVLRWDRLHVFPQRVIIVRRANAKRRIVGPSSFAWVRLKRDTPNAGVRGVTRRRVQIRTRLSDHERWRLEAQRLPAAGRQDDDAVAAVEDGVHGFALQRPEVREPPDAMQRFAQGGVVRAD
jgi:hypothetical protein